VFRRVSRPTYDGLVREQVQAAAAKVTEPELELASLLNSGDTWTII
jgi:2-oxoglutarate ferredoxin oxidoreductase subunit beta